MTRRILKETWEHALRVIADHSDCKTVADIRFHKESGVLTLKKTGETEHRLPDVSDTDAFEEALLEETGPLCIVASGLLMYLTDSDTGIFFDAVQRLLLEKGGCLLTPDPESARFFMFLWQAVCKDRFIDILMQNDETRPWREELQIDNTMVIDPRWDYNRLRDKAESFLASHGLGAEFIPAYLYGPAPSEVADESKSVFKDLSYWRITPVCTRAVPDKLLKGKGHSFRSRLHERMLILELAGRVDSQSAPVLSGLYDDYKDVCETIKIDCRELQYVSSVGLRVFISMAKRCTVSLYGVNELLGEILSQTGLDALLDISPDRIDV